MAEGDQSPPIVSGGAGDWGDVRPLCGKKTPATVDSDLNKCSTVRLNV
jgi:hypothetical protein